MKRLSGVVLGVFALVATVVGCSLPADTRPIVLVYGDSLTVLSEQVAQQDFPQWHLLFFAAGGTAPCDWADGAALDRQDFKPLRVVIAFTGNTDGCVKGASGTKPTLAAFLANYDKSMQTFRDAFIGLPVSVVASPAMHDNIGWFPYNGNAALNTQYQNECTQWGWTYNPSADVQLTPGHVFTYTRPGYPGTGPLTTVRTPDGVHLTPAGELYYGRDLLR